MRLANIREREEMFRKLEIGEAKSSLSDAFSPTQSKNAPSNRGLAREKRVKEVLPPRKSLRQRNIVAYTELKLPEERLIKIAPRVEDRPKLEFKNISCKGTCKGSNEESVDFLNNITNSIQSKQKSKVKIVKPDSTKYLERISKITINPERVAKVVKERIFSVAVHPMETKVLAAAGDKWGGIGLWDVNDTEGVNNGVQVWNPHTRPINCLTWDKFNPTCLVSTAYDGTVRCTDVEKQEH